MAKSTFGTVTYTAGAVEDSRPSFNYITKTGVFKVKIDKIYGTSFTNEKTGATTDFVTFELILNDEDKIVAKELYAYTAKEADKDAGIKKGDMVKSKGYNLVAAIVGMQSGKKKAVAKWTKCTVKEYGKDVNAMELKSLAGKELQVKSQIIRSIYTNKDDISAAKEDNSIARVFAITGHSLSEYEEALAIMTTKDITLEEALEEIEAKAILSEAKRVKPRYSKCTKDEWEDLKEEEDDSSDTDADDEEADEELPDLDDDADDEGTTEDEDAEKDTTDDNDDDGLPEDDDLEDIDLDDIEL